MFFYFKKHLNKFIFLLLFFKVISQFSFIKEYRYQKYTKIFTMSNGYKLMKSETKPNYKVFSFILDNNYFNLNYPQKYLTCLIFYEGISQYKELYYRNKNLEKELKMDIINSLSLSIKKNDSINSEFGEIFIPKCIMVMSLYPFFSEFERILLLIYNYSIKNIQLTKEKDNILLNLRDSSGIIKLLLIFVSLNIPFSISSFFFL